MLNHLNRFAIAVVSLVLAAPVHAAPGDLDVAFGVGGKVILPSEISAIAVAVQPDGRIVVVGGGRAGFAVSRVNTDGALDLTFGSGGIASTAFTDIGYDSGTAVVLQPDGKIVVSGMTAHFFNDPSVQTYAALARYNADGTLDAGFGNRGKVMGTSHDNFNAIALQSDGKIVVAGSTQDAIAVWRYNANGTLDATFGDGGKVVTRMEGPLYGSVGALPSSAQAVLIQADGNIVVIGTVVSPVPLTLTAMVRYSVTGSIDPGFSTGGRLLIADMPVDAVYAARLLPGGKILVATQSRLARFNAQGNLDYTFGSEFVGDSGFGLAGAGVDTSFGFSTSTVATALQSNGKIVLAGTRMTSARPANRFAVARFASDGTVDAAFGGGQIVIENAASSKVIGDQASSIAIQPDGKIVVVGLTDAATDANGNPSALIVRLLGDPPGPPLDAAPNYEGLWWNSPAGSEAGWGINFAHQGDIIFATWFTYDATGKAWWLSMAANKTGPNIYAGDLVTTHGPAFSATPFDPNAVTHANVGHATLTFTDANTAQFTYTVSGVTQTKILARQVFGTLPTCTFGAQANLSLATNYQDLWWAAPAGSESGWGINLTKQSDVIFGTWFTYDVNGAPLWLSITATNTASGVYSGTLFRTTGPAFNAVPFNPALVVRTPVGTATFAFADGANAVFSYVVNGVSQSKAITREVFVSPGTVCQ